MPAQIKTRVLLLSDTHASLPQPEGSHHVAYRLPLPEADVAIHTGDLTMTGTFEEHVRAVSLLKSIRAPLKIVVPGNHDLTLDRAYYTNKRDISHPDMNSTDQELDEIQRLYTGSDALSSGIHYIIEGTRTFRLTNGASLTIYASAFTPEFCDWAFPYARFEDRFNSDTASNPIPSFDSSKPHPSPTRDQNRNIDILMTHGPPRTVLDKTSTGEEVGCDHLLSAVIRCRPLIHCFGHIHESWGAKIKSWAPSTSTSTETDSENPTASSTNILRNQHHRNPHRWQIESRSNEKSLMVDHAAALDEMGVFIDAMDLDRGNETLFVNASIMSLEYKPVQAPFVIDMPLDKWEMF